MISLEKLFLSSKFHAYDGMDDSELFIVFPRAYFFVENIEELVKIKFAGSSSLEIVSDLMAIADELALVNLRKIWDESFHELSRCQTSRLGIKSCLHSCYRFEAMDSYVDKSRLVISQIRHILHDDVTSDCDLYCCCALFESPVFLNILSLLISATIICLRKYDILADVIVGLGTHGSLKCINLIERLLVNFPEKWCDIYERLLERLQILEECSHQAQYSKCLALLQHLSSIAPETKTLLNRCIQLNRYPCLVMHITNKQVERGETSLLHLFKLLLVDRGSSTRLWFGEYLKESWALNVAFAEDVRNRILALVPVVSEDRSFILPKEKVAQAIDFLRTIAAMCSFTDIELSPDLRDYLLRLVTSSTGLCVKSANYVRFCLAFVIGFRSCFHDVNERSLAETDEMLARWLQLLVSKRDLFEIPGQDSSYSEFLLLVGLLFSTNQQVAIREIVINTLEVDAHCISRNIAASRKLFIHKNFSAPSIAAQAANVPFTGQLNAKMTGYLPIHCVHQLLKTHSFNKNRVHIKGWIYRQLSDCIRPLHPMVLEVLETYASNVLSHSASCSLTYGLGGENGEGDVGCVPFTEDELLAKFSPPDLDQDAHICAQGTVAVETFHLSMGTRGLKEDLTPQLLFLYYMLYIYDQELNARSSDVRGHKRSVPKAPLALFSDELWDAVPITYLLQYARANLNSYRQLYPRLLQLVSTHRPHLVMGGLRILNELFLNPCWSCGSGELPEHLYFVSDHLLCSKASCPSPQALSHACKRIILAKAKGSKLDPDAAAACLHMTFSLARNVSLMRDFDRLRALLPHRQTVACLLPRVLIDCLELATNRRFGVAVNFLWRCLDYTMPVSLSILTAKALIPVEKAQALTQLTYPDICKNYFENILADVDYRVYRCPPALNLVLRVLEVNMLAFRSFWKQRVDLYRFFPCFNLFSNDSNGIGSKKVVGMVGSLAGQAFLMGGTEEEIMSGGGGVGQGGRSKKSGKAPPESSSSGSNTEVAPVRAELMENLKCSVILAHESAVVQWLFERCLPQKEEQDLDSEVTDAHEVRNIIYSFANSLFINDSSLCSIVFTQGYPRSVNEVATRINPATQYYEKIIFDIVRNCGDIETVVFCLDYISHLALHVNTFSISDLSKVLMDIIRYIFHQYSTTDELANLVVACGAPFCRLARAFPNLGHVMANLLLCSVTRFDEAVMLIESEGTLMHEQLVRRLHRSYFGSTRDGKMEECHSVQMVSDDSGLVSRMNRMPRLQRYVLACEHAFFWFDQLVRLSNTQRRLYLTPSLAEITFGRKTGPSSEVVYSPAGC